MDGPRRHRDATVTSGASPRLAAGDESARETADGLSLNEAHAVVESFALGVLLGRVGDGRAAFVTAAAVAGLPDRAPVGIGLQTMCREPWWSLVGLAAGYVLGDRQ